MMFGLNEIDAIVILFFVISTTILLFNLYTIAVLRKEKASLGDDQKLLVKLLGEIQGYFGRIDTTIKSSSLDERHFYETIHRNQSHENTILEALEHNQELFLERMDRIVSIQQKLSDKITALEHQEAQPIRPEMVKMAGTFMALQKRDMDLVKTKLDGMATLSSTLKNLETRIQAIESMMEGGFAHVAADLKRGVNQNMLEVNEAFGSLNRSIEEKTLKLNEGIDTLLRTKEQVGSLNTHIDIAKRNMQSIIEQSIDITLVYKSIHELLNRVSNMFHDYHVAKGEMEAMVHTLQKHEHKDLEALRDDVEAFLSEVRIELHNAVETIKREYHLSHTQVADSVKKLSNRSMLAQVYTERRP